MTTKRYLSMSVVPSGAGTNPNAWRRAGRNAVFNFEARLEIARLAREGGFDSVWLPDLPHQAATPGAMITFPFEPQLLMAAIASAVPEIGLVPTVSSTYSHPYNMARSVLTLDRISQGRAGINVVASYSPTVARNFGEQIVPDEGARFARADEYFTVLKKLFDSYRLDPGYTDAPGEFADLFNRELIHPIDYEGRHFSVEGPNTTPLWNGERPLIATAGGSEHSIDLAVRHADAFYVVALSREASAQFNRTVRQRLVSAGRRAGDMVIIPGVMIVLGSTEAEAQRELQRRLELSGDGRSNLQRVSQLLGIPPDELDADKPLTEHQLAVPHANFARPYGFFRALTDLAREEGLTVDQLGQRIQLGVGHRLLTGTPESVADDLGAWFESGAADGFTVHLNSARDELPPIVDHLMPLLRKRGTVRPGYEPGSLRKRFGLE